MTEFICFMIGLFVGGVIGVMCMALVTAHRYDKFTEPEEGVSQC